MNVNRTTYNGQWNASQFFADLTSKNRLAVSENFTFCKVSGLEGFEEALSQAQSASAFVCVSDIADGYTELNNTPRTRRVKTVFLAMRHAAEDMDVRNSCMETMRELFRQFMSVLLLERVKLEQNCIYLDPRISFNEIDRYFFTGCACAYFQIAVDVYTDLRYSDAEWLQPEPPVDPMVEIWLLEFSSSHKVISLIAEILDITLMEAYKIKLSPCPCKILEIPKSASTDLLQRFANIGATIQIK